MFSFNNGPFTAQNFFAGLSPDSYTLVVRDQSGCFSELTLDITQPNGEFVNWDDANIHVMAHVVNYGSSVFEGIRCYETVEGPAIFRLTEHMQRLVNSAKIYRMDSQFSRSDFCDAAVKLVSDSGLESCYLRPLIFRGLDPEKPAFGVFPLNIPIESYIAAWQ